MSRLFYHLKIFLSTFSKVFYLKSFLVDKIFRLTYNKRTARATRKNSTKGKDFYDQFTHSALYRQK